VADTLEALRDVAVGLHHGVLVRDPSALMRLPSAGLIAVDDHPSLRRHGLDLVMIQTPLPESESVLRYAAAAARHLGDDRAEALADACRARSITMLRLDAESVSESVVVRHRRRHVRLFGLPPNADAAAPLGLEIDGRFVATLRFRRSRRPAAAGAIARLRARTSVPFVLLSDHPARETAQLAATLGIEQHLGGLSVDDRARFLHDCQARGLRPVWVGAAGAAPRLAPACHVAIAHADDDLDLDLGTSPAAVLLLVPGLGPLADLWDIAGGHAERLRSAERSVLVPNLLCVAGAFTLGLSSLATVCVSNLGTYGVYSRSAATLRALRHAGRPLANPMARVHLASPAGGVPHVAAPA
jgi:Cu2+-exporting ATPase